MIYFKFYEVRDRHRLSTSPHPHPQSQQRESVFLKEDHVLVLESRSPPWHDSAMRSRLRFARFPACPLPHASSAAAALHHLPHCIPASGVHSPPPYVSPMTSTRNLPFEELRDNLLSARIVSGMRRHRALERSGALREPMIEWYGGCSSTSCACSRPRARSARSIAPGVRLMSVLSRVSTLVVTQMDRSLDSGLGKFCESGLSSIPIP